MLSTLAGAHFEINIWAQQKSGIDVSICIHAVKKFALDSSLDYKAYFGRFIVMGSET